MEKISIGEEVVQWAEKGWLIDKFLKGEIKDDTNNEVFSYEYFRKIFINKINNCIKERLDPPLRPERNELPPLRKEL